MNKCIGIQLRRCSPKLGQTFTNVNKQLLSPECQAAGPTTVLKESPFTSVLSLCGLPLGGEIIVQMLKIKETGSDMEKATIGIVRDLIPVGCG
jgi:hypothetical protein